MWAAPRVTPGTRAAVALAANRILSCGSAGEACARQELHEGAQQELITIMLKRLDTPARFEMHMLVRPGPPCQVLGGM